jgi:hypothetical protein
LDFLAVENAAKTAPGLLFDLKQLEQKANPGSQLAIKAVQDWNTSHVIFSK